MNNENGTPEQWLQDAGGAILYWQIPNHMQDAFNKAQAEGHIKFDAQMDCFVHPEAVRVYANHGRGKRAFGYTMPGEYQ